MDTENSDATQLERDTQADEFRIRLKDVFDSRDETYRSDGRQSRALRQGPVMGSNTGQAGCAVKQMCPRDWHRAPQLLRSCRLTNES